MIRLPRTLNAWQTPAFSAVLKDEIARLPADLLPLQQGLAQSSHVSPDNKLGVMILNVADAGPDCLCVKVGLVYTGIIAGCSCADDPTPIDEINEYCEVLFAIDKKTADTTVTLLRG
jgi:hypothetical protein